MRDALRIMAWQVYKSENKVRGLEGYEQFLEEWKEHEVHNMDLTKLNKLISGLGYSMNELANIRNEYYSRRNNQENGFLEKTDLDSEAMF